jgi:hypothetical protein
MKPPRVTEPLSSEELARDAEDRQVPTDRITADGEDPHFPASEGAPEGSEDRSRRKAARVEADVTLLPPG